MGRACIRLLLLVAVIRVAPFSGGSAVLPGSLQCAATSRLPFAVRLQQSSALPAVATLSSKVDDAPTYTPSAVPHEEEEGGTALRTAHFLSFLLQTLPPAATGITAATLLLDSVALPVWLTLYLSFETAHYLFSITSTRALTGRNGALPVRHDDGQVALWQQCLDDSTLPTSEFIKGWFHRTDEDAPLNGDSISITLDELRYDNVVDWLAYALYAQPLQSLSSSSLRTLHRCVRMLEASLSEEARSNGDGGGLFGGGAAWRRGSDAFKEAPPFAFPAGFNPQLRSWRLNLDHPATNIRPRPLLYYGITETACSVVLPWMMRKRGFKLHKIRGLAYWYHPGSRPGVNERPPPGELLERQSRVPRLRRAWSRVRRPWPLRRDRGSSSAAGSGGSSAAHMATPIVFVHGVGLGPLPYLGFITEMLDNSNGAPMMVIELPFVSQRLGGLSGSTAPHEEKTTAQIADAMAAHDMTQATFVGHSLGTIYLAWLARLRPSLLASLVFIDPITFLLHHHKVAQSFIYSRPEPGSMQGRCEHYFIKSEQSIVSYFHKHFYWYANILWAHQLPAPSAVLLSEDDNIVPSSEVHEYLSDAQARDGGGLRGSGSTVRRLHMMRGQRHGGFLLDAPSKQLVLDTVRDAQSWGAESGARLRDGRRRGPEPPIGRRVRMSWWRGGGGGPFGFVDLSEMGVRVLYVAVGAAGALQERLGALFHLPDWWMTEERSATTPAEARRSRK